MKILKWTWRLLKLTRAPIFAALLIASLSLNFALFTGGLVYNVASSAFEAVTGRRTIASQQASIVAELAEDIDLERKVNQELHGEIADISEELVNEKKITKKLGVEIADIGEDLTLARQMSKQMRKELTDPKSHIVTYKGRKMALSKAVETTSDTVSRRAAKTATREIASMGGEALPLIGTSVIVAATAFELYDLCETIKDMNALKFAFNPDLKPSEEEATVCSMKVPTKEELWESAKASPRAAWKTAREHTPTIENVQNYEFPDVDWTGVWTTSTGTTDRLKSATVEAPKGAGNLWTTDTEASGSSPEQ